MFTAKFIKNIFLEAESIKAIGRSGKKTRVFAKQGDLDGSCTIYSLMMMLIFHQKLDWEDLIDGERAKDVNLLVVSNMNFCMVLMDSVLVGTNCEKSQTERTNALVAKCVRRIQQSQVLRIP